MHLDFELRLCRSWLGQCGVYLRCLSDTCTERDRTPLIYMHLFPIIKWEWARTFTPGNGCSGPQLAATLVHNLFDGVSHPPYLTRIPIYIYPTVARNEIHHRTLECSHSKCLFCFVTVLYHAVHQTEKIHFIEAYPLHFQSFAHK